MNKFKQTILTLLLCAAGMTAWAQNSVVSYINTNNVNGRFLSDGTMHIIDHNFIDHNLIPCPTWEVPAGSGKETILQHSLWFGGLDSDDGLHLAAVRFNEYGRDFYQGPLRTSDAGADLMAALKFLHIWNLTSAEIDYFRVHYNDASYNIPDDILTWPAHGDEGYAANIAPFVDVNGDGHYNPADGDYPDIKGDQCLFFVFNDNYAPHTESGGEPIGLEVHAMVYAYDAPDNDALNNTVFVNYKFYNRSDRDYHDVYLGLWTDWNLGYSYDDYVGCDVRRSSCFAYNGNLTDSHYGDNPPVQICTILAGPYMDADGRDNPAFNGECNSLFNNAHPLDKYAYNGFNFGNGIADDERLGMCGFVYHNNDPSYAIEYYQMMHCIWKDGNPMHYGGNSYTGDNVVGPECKFMFPADTDPCNFGTNGVAPNDGYNTNGKYWTEEQCGNQPGDRRGLACVGPFSFEHGGMQELDYAIITAWKNGSHSAFERKGEFIDAVRAFFNTEIAK